MKFHKDEGMFRIREDNQVRWTFERDRPGAEERWFEFPDRKIWWQTYGLQ